MSFPRRLREVEPNILDIGIRISFARSTLRPISLEKVQEISDGSDGGKQKQQLAPVASTQGSDGNQISVGEATDQKPLSLAGFDASDAILHTEGTEGENLPDWVTGAQEDIREVLEAEEVKP